MDLEDLMAEFRQQADDKGFQPLYVDEDLPKWANEAEREAAVRARLLFDDTSAFLTLPVVAATVRYAIDPRIQVIDGAFFAPTVGRQRLLDLTGLDDLRQHDTHLCRTCNRPAALVHIEQSAIRLWPIPTSTVAGSLKLEVYRLPLEDMVDSDDAPEIGAIHHLGLVDWMLYRAYATKDGEDGDPVRSKTHYDAFEARFGERPTADVLRRHREKRRVTTTYGGL